MEPQSRADELPSLYRAILDRVAKLEGDGRRSDAARIRTAATRAYSRAWDERARRDLLDLLRRAERQIPSERQANVSPARSLGRAATPQTATSGATPDR